MTKKIPLTHGKVTVVDDDDYGRVSGFRWYARRSRNTWYAMSHNAIPGKLTGIHRLLLNAPDDLQVDHINGDGLDNRRGNLRLCTQNQNQHNRGKSGHNTSGYKGVHWDKWHGRWKAQIILDNRKIHLGYFDSPEDGADAYDNAARKYHGEFARVNS